MFSIRLSLVALACGVGLTRGALAEDPGVVRITDRRANSATTNRTAPISRRNAVAPASFDHHLGGEEYVGGEYGPDAGLHGGEVHGEQYGGDWQGDYGVVAGPEVIGDYGCYPGQAWCHGECEYECQGSFCDKLRITKNPLLDAPATLTCEFVGSMWTRFRSSRCCPSCCRKCKYDDDDHDDAYARGHRFPRDRDREAGRGVSGTRVYAVDANHFDQRDGRAYAAQGYGVPIAVPTAPTVHHTYNYGWGIPSSRITPISRPAGH